MTQQNETNAFVAHMNAIRKSWVSIVTDSVREILFALPQEQRFAHYKVIDDSVNGLYNQKMQIIRDSGNTPDAVAVMNEAAQEVVATLIENQTN
ncbi:RNA polymerase binding protein [Pectobacterium phage POP12]|nr:RNA polymerase binding protein [Pectobacterium phage POP12]